MTSPTGDSSEVAVKILHPGIDPTAQAIQRLQDEARLLGLLQHPSIIRVVDLLAYKGRLALVTEYVDGEDLSTCFDAVPPPSPRAMVEIVGRVANALDAAWRAPSPDGAGLLRLIHRDIKPSNIRISSSGDVKLLDFGLAHADHADRQAQTENHSLIGSFLYMAPERYLQRPDASASDAFGLGCCLYEGIAGEKLFEGRKPVDLYALLLDAGRWDAFMDDRVAAVPSTVPQGVRDLCRSLLSREPDERMTVTALADTWEDVVEQLTGPTLQRWVGSRSWNAPPPVKASLEGSLVASRIVQQTFAPSHDEEDDADDEPTVRVQSSPELRALVDEVVQNHTPAAAERVAFAPTSRVSGSAPPASSPRARTEPYVKPVPASKPSSQATAPFARASRDAGDDERASSVNWLGAGVLVTTTLVVAAAVFVVAVFVFSVLMSRTPATEAPPSQVVALPPTPPPAATAHVDVQGVVEAKLQRGRDTIPTGDVPPGIWVLWVDFGDGLTRVGTLRLPKEETITVQCNAGEKRCRMPGDDDPVGSPAP